MVDIVLEGRGSIAKAEWHDEGLKEAEPSDKGCLPLVALCDPHVVECGDDVQLGIDLGVAQSV